MTRPDSQNYIDENVSSIGDLNIESDSNASFASGSSVEEESDDGPMQGLQGQPGEIVNETANTRLQDFAHLDQRRALQQPETDSEESDWDVDDEDWELANGGTTPSTARC